MKKIVLLTGFLVSICCTAQAQTFAEWFKQKSTQKKYLLQQIAALQVHIDYAQKGYEIAGKGIYTIRSIKNGDFNLHNNFFQSLEAVNPTIGKYVKVAEILSYQAVIIRQVKFTLNGIRQSARFTSSELAYIKNVFDHLLTDCIKTIDALIAIITSGELKMKENERLQKINELDRGMQEKAGFCNSFCRNAQMLSGQRLHEQIEIDYSKRLDAIK